MLQESTPPFAMVIFENARTQVAIMKRILLTTAALVACAAFSFAARAADMQMPYKAPPPPPQVVSWTGCYVSAGWGYGMLDDERSGSDPTRPDSTSAAKGWMGVFGGGCDYQFNGSPFGPIVVGVFGDYDPMDIHGSYGDPFEDHHSGTQTLQDAWYVGGRAGLLITPKLLTYFDGGWTGAHINQINIFHTDGTPVDGGLYLPSEDATGWFIGGGTEYAFTFLPINGLFWKTEYRFASYDGYDQNYVHPTFIGSSVVHNSVDVQTITTSLVWRFNWNGQ
jgi:outer membrane immunogenic protein